MNISRVYGEFKYRHETARALSRYDLAGGLAHDEVARPFAIEKLATALEITFDAAAILLADALARRAANKLGESK